MLEIQWVRKKFIYSCQTETKHRLYTGWGGQSWTKTFFFNIEAFMSY